MANDDGVIPCPVYGLNPCIIKCFTCENDAGLALIGELTEKRANEMFGKDLVRSMTYTIQNGKLYHEAPRNVVFGPSYTCDDCQKKLETMIMLFSTSGALFIKDEALKSIITDSDLFTRIKSRRIAQVDPTVISHIMSLATSSKEGGTDEHKAEESAISG